MKIFSKATYFLRNGYLMVRAITDNGLEEMKLNSVQYPYAYIQEKDVYALKKFKIKEIVYPDLKTIDGKTVVKFTVYSPPYMPTVRESLKKKGIPIYEADIPFIRRLLIDKVLKVNYSKKNIVYIDLELDDSRGMPLKYGEFEIISIAAIDEDDTYWFYKDDYNSEAQMLFAFLSYLKTMRRTIFVGWNVAFDYNHLIERSKVLGVYDEYLDLCDYIDLHDLYYKEVKGLSSYTLEEVARHEGKMQKIKREKPIHRMNREELEKYNVRDVEIVKEIDKEYGFTELKLQLANMVNLTTDMLSPLLLGDSVVIRRIKELGKVAPTKEKHEKEPYIGAFVKTPKAGLHRNIAVFDVTSMYPMIIINENIDIDGFRGEVLPHLERTFLKARNFAKKMYKKTKDKKYNVQQKSIKVVCNALYGLLGLKHFRFYNFKKAAKITTTGRKILKEIEKCVEDLGLSVLYQDTDSVFVPLSSEDDLKTVAIGLQDYINMMIEPYEVKLEYIFDKILFFGSEEKGTKKKYIGITKDGKKVVKGVEMRRRDWSPLAKRVMDEVCKMVFDGKAKSEILAYLADIKKHLYKGKLDEELVITKSVKNLEDYKVKQPHVRALEKALQLGAGVMAGKISYVYYGNNQVMPVIEGKLLKPVKNLVILNISHLRESLNIGWLRRIKNCVEVLLKNLLRLLIVLRVKLMRCFLI